MGTLLAVYPKYHARNEALQLVPIHSTPTQKLMSKGHSQNEKHLLVAHRDLIGDEVKAIV